MTGYYGIGIFHAKTEHNIGSLMRAAACFGANFVFTIGRRYSRQSSDTMNATKQVPCFNYRDIDDLIAHLPLATPLIGVELTEGAKHVGRYTHLHRCVYLLGAEDNGLPESVLERCHSKLIIPGTSRCLNVSNAGSIVLFDRYNQRRTA